MLESPGNSTEINPIERLCDYMKNKTVVRKPAYVGGLKNVWKTRILEDYEYLRRDLCLY